MKRTVSFREPVSQYVSSELARQIYYLSPEISGFRMLGSGEIWHGVELDLSHDIETHKLEEKLNFVLDADLRRRREVPASCLWRCDNKREYRHRLFEELVENRLAFESGDGQIALGGLFLKCLRAIDSELRSTVSNLFPVEEYRYPTLIPTSVLQKCGVFESFPQLVMVVTRLHNDTDIYEKFRSMAGPSGVSERIMSYCQNADYCLPPTMCYHTYHQFAQSVFQPDESRVVTARGKAFRYESRYRVGLERLWDFTIREIVFLGSFAFVASARTAVMEAAFRLIEDLDLAGYCGTANDPFFFSESSNAKTTLQQGLKWKYELRLNVRPDETIAVGSFNLHDDFFSSRFGLRFESGGTIKTGCVGFGLERFVYAILCQHGLDETKWPPRLRNAIAGGFP